MSSAEDAIMLIRSVLCSQKNAISFKELIDDYYEMSGSRIPYKQLGFNTLQDFLRSYPDKFRVRQEGNDFTISAVLDKDLVDLAKLVQGQKKTKKKKKAAKPIYKKPSPYANFTFKNQKSNISNSPSHQFNRYHSINSVQNEQRNKISTKSKDPVVSSKKLSSLLDTNNNQIKPLLSKKVTPYTASSTSIEDLFITNAAYFLKEHMVYLSHVETINKVYIRLIGDNFSGKYENMMQEMNSFLKRSKIPMETNFIRKNSFCIGLDKKTTKYYRLQVQNVIVEKGCEEKISCFYLDEGRTELYQIQDLYTMPDQFLQLKFQAIEVRVAFFEMLGNSKYILEAINQRLSHKKYLARRITGTKQLTVSLFNSKNQCMDESFFRKYDNFIDFKPTEGFEFKAYISFIDDESSLVYLQLPGDLKMKFDEKMIAINQYFSTELSNQHLIDNEYLKKNITDFTNEICVAKYELDNLWYRVKIVRKWNDNTVLVHFIDYGNREKVELNSLRVIPDTFSDFKYMPPQAFTVLILSKEHKEEELKDCLYENKEINLKVVRINAAGIPSVRITSIIEPEGVDQYEPIVDQMNSSLFIKEECNESELHDIQYVMHKDLAETNLPAKSKVYVSCINNPVDFVINLESAQSAYELLKQAMKKFYAKEQVLSKYLCKEPVKEYIYVLRNKETGGCTRVKFIDYVVGDMARLYDIDSGKFDAVKIDSNFHYITREFLQLKPLGIKAKLSNLIYETSIPSKVYFKSLVQDKKIFSANIVKFELETNFFLIELYNDRGDNINKILVDKGYARAC